MLYPQEVYERGRGRLAPRGQDGVNADASVGRACGRGSTGTVGYRTGAVRWPSRTGEVSGSDAKHCGALQWRAGEQGGHGPPQCHGVGCGSLPQDAGTPRPRRAGQSKGTDTHHDGDAQHQQAAALRHRHARTVPSGPRGLIDLGRSDRGIERGSIHRTVRSHHGDRTMIDGGGISDDRVERGEDAQDQERTEESSRPLRRLSPWGRRSLMHVSQHIGLAQESLWGTRLEIYGWGV